MILRPSRALTVSVSMILIVCASGCATKKYVGKKINVVDQKLNQLNQHQAQTHEELEKHQQQLSQLGERITTTDSHLAAVNSTAQQANTTATQALQQTSVNAAAIESHSAELEKLGKQFDYSLVASDNVMFGFNKWELTTNAKGELDQIVQKALANPRSKIELLGYTDDIGTSSYNLGLSLRRAQAVQRYLVKNNVPPMNVSLIGLGEETRTQLAAEGDNPKPDATKREVRALARRVYIKLYAPGQGSPAASASAGQGSQD